MRRKQIQIVIRNRRYGPRLKAYQEGAGERLWCLGDPGTPGSVPVLLVWYKGNVGSVADTTSWIGERSSDDREQEEVSESTVVRRRHVRRARSGNLARRC